MENSLAIVTTQTQAGKRPKQLGGPPKKKKKKTTTYPPTEQPEQFCVIYKRVSTDEQEKEGVSLDSQERRCREYANFMKWKIRGVFQDVMSGTKKDNREGIINALETLQKGDKLVIVALSRLSRSTKDMIAISEELKEKGCDLVSVTEQMDTKTATGYCYFMILNVINEMESKQTGERVRAGMNHKQKLGEDLGPPPFGWEYIEKVLVKKPDEWEVVKLIKEKSKSGYSYNNICTFLTNEGILTKNGKKRIERGKPPTKWCTSTISHILNNPRNQSDAEEESEPEEEEGAEKNVEEDPEESGDEEEEELENKSQSV
jgi:site-specific DNA recombinase